MANYDNSSDFWKGTYIGNVAGSAGSTTGNAADDTKIITELFETSNITMEMDGESIEVTLIIKWEDIDDNEATGTTFELTNENTNQTVEYKGCEMTLYMTTEDLNDSWSSGEYAKTIYAIAYTCDETADAEGNTSYSQWYQYSEIYSGEAQVVGYVGGTTNGSFDTGEWRSTEEYYGLSTGTGISEIVKAYLAQN